VKLKNYMNKTLITLLLIAFEIMPQEAAKASEQNTPTNTFEVQISSSTREIFPFEPVLISFSIKNLSDAPNTNLLRSGSSLAIQRNGENSWHIICPYNFSPPPLAKPIQVVFEAKQTITESQVLGVNYNGDPVFQYPGVYSIKAITPFGESKSTKILVNSVPDNEGDVIDEVRKQKLFLWFGWADNPSYFGDYGDEIKSQIAKTNLLAMVRLHSNSRYAQWAALGIFWNEKNKIEKDIESRKTDLEAAMAALKQIQTNMEEQASKYPEPIQSYCWYGAGVIAVQLGDKEYAKNVFAKISKTTAADFFSEQTTKALSNTVPLLK
jgi:hypothetical protein